MNIAGLFYFCYDNAPHAYPYIGVKNVFNSQIDISQYRFISNSQQTDARAVQLYTDTSFTIEDNRAYNMHVSGNVYDIKPFTDSGKISSDKAGNVNPNFIRLTDNSITVTNDTGFLIAYIPQPNSNGDYAGQSFEIVSENMYLNIEASLNIVRSDSAADLLSVSFKRYIIPKALPINTAHPYFVLGALTQVAGKPVYPIYLMFKFDNTTDSLFLANLAVRCNDKTPNSFRWFLHSISKITLTDANEIRRAEV
jgi:hypothetical protein